MGVNWEEVRRRILEMLSAASNRKASPAHPLLSVVEGVRLEPLEAPPQEPALSVRYEASGQVAHFASIKNFWSSAAWYDAGESIGVLMSIMPKGVVARRAGRVGSCDQLDGAFSLGMRGMLAWAGEVLIEFGDGEVAAFNFRDGLFGCTCGEFRGTNESLKPLKNHVWLCKHVIAAFRRREVYAEVLQRALAEGAEWEESLGRAMRLGGVFWKNWVYYFIQHVFSKMKMRLAFILWLS